MGCVCCCLNVRDPHEEVNPNSGSCICLNSLIHTIFRKYESLFIENQIDTLPSASQGHGGGQADVSSNSNVPTDNITCLRRSFRLDPNSDMQRDTTVVPNPEKGTTGGALRLDKESEQFSSSSYISLEHIKGQLVKKGCLDPSLKSSEDEDFCPTCLEEYTPENPRTIMQCSHHYHLSCIFEWMERSPTCPVCGKVMLFDEAT